MDNDNIEKRIVLSVDKAAADAGLKAIQSYDKGVTNLGKSLKGVGKSASDYGAELRRAIKGDSAVRSVKSLNTAFSEQVQDVKQATNAIDAYEERLRQVQRSGTDLSGDVASSFGGIRGAVTAFGGGGVSPALDIVEGFADIGEFAPRLKVQLQSVGEAMQASTSAAGKTVSGIGEVVGSVTGLGASLGTVLTVAVPLALAVGGVALAMSQFTKEAEKQAQALNTVIDAQRSVGQQVASGLTTEDATARLAEVNRLREEEQALLERQKAAYQEAMDALGGLGFVAQQIAPQEQALADQIAASEAAIAGYNSEISALNTRLGDGSIAANDTAAAEEELARTREQDAQRSIAQTEAANQRILALNEQRDSAIENRLIQRANAAQSTKLESGFAEEDEKAELTKHLADLQAIRETGYQKELELAKEIADLPNQQAKDLGEVTAKGTAQLDKLNQDYFANQIKATKDFAKESARINDEVAKNARRIAEDLADRLSDAARDNDVVAFLQAEKEGQKEIRRNAEDAKDAEKQRQEDFLDQQEEQRQAYNQRQQEILRQVDEEKQKVIQSYAEKRQALEQQIQQERANTQQAIANAQARYQQEEALEDQQAKRNAQRLQLRDQQEQAAFQRSLNAINSKVNAELQGLARIQQAAMSLGSNMSSKSNYSKPAPSQYVSPYANGKPTSTGGFTKGGINVNVSMSNNVGDVASMTALNAASNQIQQNVQQAVIRAVQGAQG